MKTPSILKQQNDIIRILQFAKEVNPNKWLTTNEIVNISNALGLTTPFYDEKRKATSHPYSKVLSLTRDFWDGGKYYKKKVFYRKSSKDMRKYEFRLE